MTNPKQPLFLRILKNGKLLDVKQFGGEQIVIGREGKVDAMINDPSLSPIHAMIEEREPGKYFLCDLGSQSGTFVNNEKVVDAQLESGSEFRLGDVTIEFHVGVPRPKKVSQETVTGSHQAPAAPPKATPPPMAAKPVEPLPKPIPKEAPKKEAVKKPVPTQSVAAATAMGLATAGGSSKLSQYAKPKKVTFAPPSSARINETIKPTKGTTVEVVVAWKDRILNTYHFDRAQMVQIGSHPGNQIVLPMFGSVRVAHPLIKIEGIAQILLTQDMTGEIVKDGQTLSFEDLRRKGAMMPSGVGFTYALQQGELIRISLGEGIVVIIRYVETAPESRLMPFIDLSVNQLTAIVVGLMGTALFLFYAFLYAPSLPEKPEEEVEPPRKAQFFYKKQEAVELSPEPVAHNAAETVKTKEPAAPAQGEEGASAEPKHTDTNNTVAKKKGTSKKATAAAAPKAPPQKDVSKSGLLGAFATKGMQDQLNKAFKGSGNVSGLSKNATGSAADGEGNGVGGSALRDTGANGNGTATVGITGVKTKGRGGGVTGYGTGSLGAKKNASLVAGDSDATFSGTIDKEAIRRVVQANLKQIKACYERGLNKDPGLYGKIVIQWTIGSGGRVLEAGIKNTTMNSSEVENCAVARLRTWKFPEPPSGEVAVVSYPFVFQAQE